MAKVDDIYKETCRNIFCNGSSTEGQKVRPIWPDTGEKAYTLKQFGVCNRYDLREEFPLLTLRKINLEGCMKEILWIYQKKSNKIEDLGLHIWDEWAKDGSIGKAYGYQIAQRYVHHSVSLKDMEPEELVSLILDLEENYPSVFISCTKGKINCEVYVHNNTLFVDAVVGTLKGDDAFKLLLPSTGKIDISFDQMDAVLYDLKNNPFSRRIMTSTYTFDDLHEMNLYPCAYSTTWNVTDEGYEKPILNLILNQRSLDFLTAGNWNVAQYALLLMMVAQSVDMIPGVLLHVVADAHIYDRHVPLVEKVIKNEGYDAPAVKLNPEIKNFYDFKVEDLIIGDYKYHKPDIGNIPVAV